MSVIIKGISKQTVEKLLKTDYPYYLDKIIELPEGHGRIIDADKIFTYDKMAEDQLKEVPTILEEEK